MMLAVPMNGGVQPRLIPPAFVKDNIGEMFDAVDAGLTVDVTAVDQHGNHVIVPTPDGANHDMLGRPLKFASHPVLMQNVRRWLIWLLQAQYCREYAWDAAELGDWTACIGLPDDLNVTVTDEHLRLLKPVFNKDDADVCKLVTQYDRQHYAPCTLGTLIRLAERTTPNYALGRETHWCMADRYRKIVVQPTPKEDWDGMNRVRDRWSGCEWVYPALEQSVNPVKLLRREFKQGGLPESFHYPLETDKGEFRLNHISQRAIILLDGKPVGLMVHDDCDEPFTDKVPPEWCAIRLPDGVTGRAIYSVLPDEGDEFKPSFQQALLDFADRF